MQCGGQITRRLILESHMNPMTDGSIWRPIRPNLRVL
jgi:hypothetical protein